MKKNIPYLLIALALLGVVAYLVISNRSANSTANDQDFNAHDVESLERIFIAAKDGRTIKLDRVDDHWVVNDKFKAMPAKVDLLLSTLHSYQVFSPVPTAARDNMVKELAVYGIKVELYPDKDDAPNQVYFVGKPNQSQTANSMLMQLDGKPAKEPYLVHIPGFIGDLQTRFLLNETDWRDLNIFRYGLDDIAKVSIMYHDRRDASFSVVVKDDNRYIVQHPDSAQPIPADKLFSAGVTKFLDSFGNLNAESTENDFIYKDSVINGPKFATIVVEDKKGGSTKLIMYRMAANRRTKTLFDQQGNAIPFDPDHYYALFNDGKDFGLVQHYVFGKVLRSYNDFVVKSAEETAQK